jgi:enoyl-[acyl-carrier protein] reductase I
VTIDEIARSALYLLSDLSRAVTGEIHHVDPGYDIISMRRPEVLKGYGRPDRRGRLRLHGRPISS